ncbi:hypothetical protein BJ170DRAFT_599430 [Xylariales sp. AK1849]|nr:hypothetical protein BJ170DRAFT_599430 [Xylariales sp. AK1849]
MYSSIKMGSRGQTPTFDETHVSSIMIESQRRDAALDKCPLRKSLVDNCAKGRFLTMTMDYYFLSGNVNPKKDCKCPMLRCQIEFSNAAAMITHLKECNRFEDGELWCPSCDTCEPFPISDKSHCSWKRESLTKKMRKSIGSLHRRYSDKKPLAHSEVVSRLSTSASTPEPPEYTENPHIHPTVAKEIPGDRLNMLDSSPISPVSELLVEDNPVEMAAGVPNTKAIAPEPVGLTRKSAEFGSWSESPNLSLGTIIACSEGNSGVRNRVVDRSRKPSYHTDLSIWSSSTASLNSSAALAFKYVGSNATRSSDISMVSLLSTTSGNDDNGGPQQPILDRGLTASPGLADFPDSLWSSMPFDGTNTAGGSTDPSLSIHELAGDLDLFPPFPNQTHLPSLEPPDSYWLAESDRPDLQEPIALPGRSHQLFASPKPRRPASLKRRFAVRQTSGSSCSTLVESGEEDQEALRDITTNTLSGHEVHDAVKSSSSRNLSAETTNDYRPCAYQPCNYTYGQAPEAEANYLRHVKRNHSVEHQRFACDQCDRSYRRRDNLQKHQRLKHSALGQVPLSKRSCTESDGILDRIPTKRFKSGDSRQHQSHVDNPVKTWARVGQRPYGIEAYT